MTTEDPSVALPRVLRDLQALPPSPDREAAITKVEAQIQIFGSEESMADAPNLGSGARFKKLLAKVAKKGAKDPGASTAAEGRKKFGAGKSARLAAKNQQSE